MKVVEEFLLDGNDFESGEAIVTALVHRNKSSVGVEIVEIRGVIFAKGDYKDLVIDNLIPYLRKSTIDIFERLIFEKYGQEVA